MPLSRLASGGGLIGLIVHGVVDCEQDGVVGAAWPAYCHSSHCPLSCLDIDSGCDVRNLRANSLRFNC